MPFTEANILSERPTLLLRKEETLRVGLRAVLALETLVAEGPFFFKARRGGAGFDPPENSRALSDLHLRPRED